MRRGRRRRRSSRADGLIALGSTASTTSLATARRACSCHVGWCASCLPFVFANGRRDSINIEVVSAANSLPQLMELFDDGVATLHDGFLVGNSSGVQMMGGLRPSERQMVSIV